MRTPTVVNSGTNLGRPLGGTATFVLIDNNTDNSAYFPAARRYCPPHVTNQLYALIPSTVAEVQWMAPPNVTEPPFTTSQQLTAEWMDTDTASAYIGTSPISAFSQPTRPLALLGTFDTVANATTTAGPFQLPSGCQAVRVVWKSTLGNVQPLKVAVSDSSGIIDWGSVFPGGGGNISNNDFLCGVVPAVDPLIKVQVQEPSGNTKHCYVLAVFEASYQQVILVGNDGVITVDVRQIAGGNIVLSGGQVGVLPVDTGVPRPAAWSIPADTATITADTVVLAANANRRGLWITNTGGADARINFGAAAATATGLPCKTGAAIFLTSPDCPQSAVHAFGQGAGTTLSVAEET